MKQMSMYLQWNMAYNFGWGGGGGGIAVSPCKETSLFCFFWGGRGGGVVVHLLLLIRYLNSVNSCNQFQERKKGLTSCMYVYIYMQLAPPPRIKNNKTKKITVYFLHIFVYFPQNVFVAVLFSGRERTG